MHEARIEAAAALFPASCVACDGPAEVAHQVMAQRGPEIRYTIRMYFVDLPVPLCQACARRRRRFGALVLTGVLVAFFAGLFAATLTAVAFSSTAAGFVSAPFWALLGWYALRGRNFVEWRTLGLSVKLLKGEGTPVEIRFRRSEYFLRWAALNRGAVGAEPALP